MTILTKLSYTTIALLIAQTALADNCIQPKVKHAESIGCLTEGLSGVVIKKSDTNYLGGYVDKAGKTVIPFIYTPDMVGEGGSFIEMSDFSQGLAAVKKTGIAGNINAEGRYGYIDKTGKTIIPFNFSTADSFSEGLAAVGNEAGKRGYIDQAGKLIIPYRYDDARPFSDSLARVSSYSENESTIKTQYIDKTGNLALTVDYDARDFSNGLARVIKEDKYGFMDKTGKVVIPIKFKYYEESEEADDLDFINGKALVRDNGKEFCINTSGKKVNCK